MFSVFKLKRVIIPILNQRIFFKTSCFIESAKDESKRRPFVKYHWSNIQPNLPCPICGQKFRDKSVLNIHIGFSHSRLISQALRKEPVKTYTKIFGGENIKSITPNELRYTNGLIITLSGDFQGCWFSFIDNIGGGPLKALRVKRNLTVAEAALQGLDLANSLGNQADLSLHPKKSKRWVTTEERNFLRQKFQSSRIEVAKNIWNASLHLKGSLGEKYLVDHRKIPSIFIERLQFRFLPKGSAYLDYREEEFVEVVSSNPALIVGVENSNGELTGIQRIFLTPETGEKPKWMKRNKYSRGILQGSGGIVQRGLKGQTVYVAEGPETAASIVASHLHSSPECPVLASLSSSNVLNLSTILLSLDPKKVVFAADNDGRDSEVTKKSFQVFSELKRFLSEHSVPMSIVIPPGEDKVDWNDVLRSQGLAKTRQIFGKELEKAETTMLSDNLETDNL